MMPTPGAPAIRLTDIHKSFGPVRANRGASLEVMRGEIHALVGENGAGKSTLMRALSGMYAPDSGRMEVADADGILHEVTGWSTAEAIAAGVGMVHQHFMLVSTLTVAENLMLGAELTKDGALRVLDTARAAREVDALSQRTGLRVNARQRVSELSVGEAQRVEILKALYRGARTLILDEPTAVLSPPEVAELWQVLRPMRARGDTIVLITHKLDEVMSISDTVTVMRHGDRKSTRLNSSHLVISYAVFCLKKKNMIPVETKCPLAIPSSSWTSISSYPATNSSSATSLYDGSKIDTVRTHRPHTISSSSTG